MDHFSAQGLQPYTYPGRTRRLRFFDSFRDLMALPRTAKWAHDAKSSVGIGGARLEPTVSFEVAEGLLTLPPTCVEIRSPRAGRGGVIRLHRNRISLSMLDSDSI